MRTVILSALLALFLAILLGVVAESGAPADRPIDLIRPVPSSWYDALPADPERATEAFLARVPPVMRERGEAVSQTRYAALAARIIVGLGALLLFLISGAAGELSLRLAHVSRRQWVRDAAFAAVLLSYAWIITLPVEVGFSYMRYRAFGFSAQPFFGWLQDYLLGWLASVPFYIVGVVVLMALVRRQPRSWPISAGLVYAGLAIALNVAMPLIIEPMTNTFTPLPDGPVKRTIEALAHEAGVPATDVYTSDASRQTRILNGHVSGGFGSARIVIDDTSLGSSLPMIMALVAHEIGHYKMAHVIKMVVVASLVALLGLALISRVAPICLRSFGTQWRVLTVADSGAIALYWLLFTAWGFVAEPLTNAYARVQETQADQFSLDLAKRPDGLAEFMIHDADIARLKPSALDIALFFSHPGDASRVAHAMRWRAEHAGRNRIE
jgi:STE24 endopeptidase